MAIGSLIPKGSIHMIWAMTCVQLWTCFVSLKTLNLLLPQRMNSQIRTFFTGRHRSGQHEQADVLFFTKSLKAGPDRRQTHHSPLARPQPSPLRVSSTSFPTQAFGRSYSCCRRHRNSILVNSFLAKYSASRPPQFLTVLERFLPFAEMKWALLVKWWEILMKIIHLKRIESNPLSCHVWHLNLAYRSLNQSKDYLKRSDDSLCHSSQQEGDKKNFKYQRKIERLSLRQERIGTTSLISQ